MILVLDASALIILARIGRLDLLRQIATAVSEERGMVRALKPILDEMMVAGFFLDNRLYRSILHEAGEELPP